MSDYRGDTLFGLNVAFFVVAATVVLLRCYTRAFISKAFGLDDGLMVLACTFFLGYVICSNIGIHYGTGRHRADLTPEDYSMSKKLWFFCYIFFGLTMMMAKLSFGWLLLRIVCARIHIWIIYLTSLVVVGVGIIFFFVTMLQCQPIARYWDETIPGTCIPIHAYVSLGYTYSAISVVTDLVFALLPAFIIWHLQLRTRVRWILIFLMGLGCIASAAVLVRIAYLGSFYDTDFLWATMDIAIWSTVEMGLAITAASFSTLRPLARSFGIKVGLTDYGSNTSEDCNNNRRVSGMPANRRPAALGIAGYNVSSDSQDTTNPFDTQARSISSSHGAHSAPGFDHATWSASRQADEEQGAASLELSSVDHTVEHGTFRRGEKQSTSEQSIKELGE